MSRRSLAAILTGLVLALGVAVWSVRVARHFGDAKLELSRVKIAQVDRATRERLATLTDDVFLTYYVSPREKMPSHMKRVEREIVDLFESLAAASDGRLTYQIIDPDTREEFTTFAAKRRIAPFRVRSIEHDAYSERTIWSSLTVAHGARAPIVVNGVGPEHVPRLQALIVEHLNQLEDPRLPVVALAAPAGFDEIGREIRSRAEVVPFSMEEAPIPPEADLLFWMQPERAGEAIARKLEAFLASGRSAVIAGGALVSSLATEDGSPSARFERLPYAGEDLWSELGLRLVDGLVQDVRSEELVLSETERLAAPFLVRCIAPNQDFHTLRGLPNGTLLFDSPTPFELDGEALAQNDVSATVLATTSERTWIDPVPREPIPLGRQPGPKSVAAPKLPLVVEVEPRDPWRGSVVACASASPFLDGWFSRPGFAHERFLEVLLDTLGSDERLVLARARIRRPEPIPPLTPSSRFLWRALVVLVLPLGFAALGIWRGALRGEAGGKRRVARTSMAPVAARALIGLVVVGAAVRGASALRLRSDWTEDGLNELSPRTVAAARRASEAGPVRAELLFTRSDRLPPDMRVGTARLRGLLEELARTEADLEVAPVPPETLSPAEVADLEAEGVRPVTVATRVEESTVVRDVWTTLRLSRGEETVDLVFPDALSFEEAEFRVAFGLWRLATGREVSIAFAPDNPRLSPAEAHHDYQQQGKFAPTGTDVYSLARERLEGLDFDVTHVNVSEPELPPDPDLVVWLQPRRDIRSMLEVAARHVHGGGSLLLAAQHFRIQPRQFRGTGFETVYWPQPQSPDVDTLWFPELGIHLVRDVVLDELKTTYRVETHVNRTHSQRDYEKQHSALPFLVRAAAANFADSPITRGLGDQAFLYGNRIAWDEERLAELGIEAQPLIRTSERAWTFPWKRGYLPEPVFDGPMTNAGTEEAPDWRPGGERAGRQPLAVLFEGRFPLPEEPLVERPPGTLPPPVPEPAPARLLLVGCSEMFRDERLLDADFRADHLLVNAVSELALPEELRGIANRRRVPRGFDWLEPTARRDWRAFVVAGAPLAVLAFGLARGLLRRRRSRGQRAGIYGVPLGTARGGRRA